MVGGESSAFMSDKKSTLFDVFADLERARNPPIWQVLGRSEKDNIIFYCRAIDEPSVREQFQVACEEDNSGAFGPLLWDYKFEDQTVAHLLLPPWLTKKDVKERGHISQRTLTLTISEIALNTITDYC